MQSGRRTASIGLIFAALGLAAAIHPPAPAKEKPPPAAEYFGHLHGYRGSRLVIHIDAFTPDDLAAKVAEAGRTGNANAIRDALGHADTGYIRLGDRTYRIAYARRITGPDGARLVLIMRNEIQNLGRSTPKEFSIPPMSAADAHIPPSGTGSVVVSGSATVTFRSADDVAITDWGSGWLECTDLAAKER